MKADVLRAWERRYGLPQPQRTPGGHRLYSEYDIETVRWLRARQDEGMSISNAVELWQDICASGRDPLADQAPSNNTIPDILSSPVTPIETLRLNWLEACMAFNSGKAEEVLNQAFAMYPIETVCIAILQHGMNTIGHYWYTGKISVQQEHFASALSIRRLNTLITSAPHPSRQQTILVGCPPEERHTFPALMLSLFLLRKGLNVIYLGADIPVDHIEETAHTLRPNLVVLAAQQLTTAATLQSVAISLQKQGFLLAYGGLIFNRIPRLREHIPGFYLGDRLDQAIHLIESLAINPVPLTALVKGGFVGESLAKIFRKKRPRIEVALMEEFLSTSTLSRYTTVANQHFGNGLMAALELGDPAFLEADMEWIEKLLGDHGFPSDALPSYLSAYSRTVELEMGVDGASITTWIESFLARTNRYASV